MGFGGAQLALLWKTMSTCQVHLQSFQCTKSFKHYLYVAAEHVTPLPKGRPVHTAVTSSQPPCPRPYKLSSCLWILPFWNLPITGNVWPSVSGSLNTMSLSSLHTVLSTRCPQAQRRKSQLESWLCNPLNHSQKRCPPLPGRKQGNQRRW